MAKKFMFVCLGILALACAYAVGAGNSVAQVGGADVVASFMPTTGQPATVVVTANGDIYSRAGYIYHPNNDGVARWSYPTAQWTYMGNALTGGVVNSQEGTLSGVKSLFR